MNPAKPLACIIQRISLYCLLLLAACNRNSPENTFNSIAAELRQQMLSDGEFATTPTAPQRNGDSFFSEWEMSCENPVHLKQLLISRLSGDFTMNLDTPELVVFSKYDGHDVARIEVHYPANSSGQARVRLTLAPD